MTKSRRRFASTTVISRDLGIGSRPEPQADHNAESIDPPNNHNWALVKNV